MKRANTVAVDAQRRDIMHVPRVDFIGAGIVPLIEWRTSALLSMAIVTYPSGEECGSGALGSFATEADAYQYGVEYGKAEAKRRLLMTLIE
ncbi:hypothetical protein AWB67_06696 [Caballeronia terrestris]|uniref:Uncharacterized protein n=1 Tax=Caballeronia terrestris TaxID=1226301 RepID=A0A158KU55_9BURK|nr:hypothetical protein [Caballeronia terrestris]SAL84505.1 hypothetical protein AWB67_06696 [Caballeronia terrestris]